MISLALEKLRPNAKWQMTNNNYDELVWLDESQTKPTKKEVDAEILKLIEKQRVQNINSYTQSYITTKYPLEKQSSADLGIYGEEYKNEMISFISNSISLSNGAIENNTSFEDYKDILNGGL